MDMILLEMLIAGALFGSMFLVGKRGKLLIGWILIAYLIVLGVGAWK